MVKRKGLRAHYESAFEDILRKCQIPYVAINENKRPIIEGEAIKNFDFIVYSKKGKYLIDIKGKFFPYEYSYRAPNYWENWITLDDIKGLKFWQKIFGKGFQSLLIYIFLIKHKKDKKQFEFIYTFKNNSYGIVGVPMEIYLKKSKPRSKKWKAIYVSREKFQRLVKPLNKLIPEVSKENNQNLARS